MIFRIHVIAVFGWPLLLLLAGEKIMAAAESEWVGQGRYRILVEVPPVENPGRSDDEMVAKVELDLGRHYPKASAGQRIDLRSLQVIRQDRPAAPYPKHVQQHSSSDRPFRFYDRGLLDEFPTWRRYASLEALGNRPMFRMTERLPYGHRVFSPVGEHVCGTLVWAHTQSGNQTSTYGIYFNLDPKTRPITSPPAGWIGDGSNRVVPMSPMSGPPGNNSGSVVDWNGDGLPDILYGISSGYASDVSDGTAVKSPWLLPWKSHGNHCL